ncbi:LeoA/HP0731 family dynamin-like GTPase [Moraxella atlantae]|uniref:LeoA/HP0731 family dynamin-like GTPase n=1 Tax=Faucicola atlantae TaxID=34059 RepID=UPI003753A970
MNATLEAFKRQAELNQLLAKLAEFLKRGAEFGINAPIEWLNKINSIQRENSDQKLKVVLIGGFSEGKTSIAAAWLGKIDKDTMNISQSESSNEVKIYSVDEKCVLIDTPGLYGYKEKRNADTAQIEKYKDITKRYVSEAHIVLYVMNSSNPIKESHKEDLVWLFKTLNLLPRTVFVLSRFDEVADVEDEEEYLRVLKIKQDDVKVRLKDLLNLTETEAQKLNIVGISANPFDEGTEYWLKNVNEFKKLSHIENLQKATTAIVEENGNINQIVNDTKKSVFLDIRQKELPEIEESHRLVKKELKELKNIYDFEEDSLRTLKKKIDHAKSNLHNDIQGYFSDLIKQVNGASMDTISDFLIDEIGDEGVLIDSKVKQIFNRNTTALHSDIKHQIIEFNNKLDTIDTAFSRMTKQGVSQLVKNIKFDNNTVKMARDMIVEGGKLIGADLSKVLKFKPWGAVHLANKLNVFLSIAGLGFEAWDSYEQHKKQEEFERAQAEMIDNLKKHQKMLIDTINSSDFTQRFFPELQLLINKVQELKQMHATQEERNKNLEKWVKDFEVLEGEFRVIT